MKTPNVNTIVATVLGAAVLCGCASNAQQAPAPTPPVAAASASAAAARTALPRDPVIDAYVGAMRADLSDGKVRAINSIMRLSTEEARVFWPIYEEYESELFDVGDQRIALIRRFGAAQRSGQLKQDDAATLADQYFQFEQQQLDLQKKYHGIIAKALSPVRAAQFAQIEHRVGTIIDLAIAAEMPLIQVSGSPPSP